MPNSRGSHADVVHDGNEMIRAGRIHLHRVRQHVLGEIDADEDNVHGLPFQAG